MESTSSTCPLLKTEAAARQLGIAKGTLQNWRARGQGPRFVRLGHAVRYCPADIQEFIAQNRIAR